MLCWTLIIKKSCDTIYVCRGTVIYTELKDNFQQCS